MSKRRISEQQSIRIAKKQMAYRQTKNMEHQPTEKGLVITRFSNHALVEDELGYQLYCSVRPNIDSLVAGDQVVFQREGGELGVIVSLYPRETVLSRPDKRGALKPVAANITQMIIVVAPKPSISWTLLDSYLVIAEHLHLQACIILNKTDLESESLQHQLKTQYEVLGYRVIYTSQQNKKNFKLLTEAFNHQISIVVGQSGVGKSSLISRILPNEIGIQTQAISKHTELGRHTTSNSYFYHLPEGGALIDSPGVREFGLWHMPAVEIAKGFREFVSLPACKFRDCNHIDIAGCALLEAVKEGKISRDRYHNYVKICTQLKTK